MTIDDNLRSEVQELLAFFSEAELLVLRTHISIHRWATITVARARKVPPESLRRLSFLAAVREAHGPRMPQDLFNAMRVLNDARNIVAHEELTGDMFIKVGELGRTIKGSTYIEDPATPGEAHHQFRYVLSFVQAWATNP